MTECWHSLCSELKNSLNHMLPPSWTELPVSPNTPFLLRLFRSDIWSACQQKGHVEQREETAPRSFLLRRPRAIRRLLANRLCLRVPLPAFSARVFWGPFAGQTLGQVNWGTVLFCPRSQERMDPEKARDKQNTTAWLLCVF